MIGWVLSGSAPTAGTTQHLILATTHVLKIDAAPAHNEQRRLEELLQSFLDLESLGIIGTEKTLYDEFCNNVTVQDGRYEVLLPWRDIHKPLPDNYNLGRKRLKGLLHHLQQNPDLLQHTTVSSRTS